jgi:hypothetical protein
MNGMAELVTCLLFVPKVCGSNLDIADKIEMPLIKWFRSIIIMKSPVGVQQHQ